MDLPSSLLEVEWLKAAFVELKCADTKQTTDARPRPRLLTRRLRGHASRHCCTSSSKQRCTACTAPAAITSQAFVHRRVVRALQMVRDGDPPRSSERGGGLGHAGWTATVDAPVAGKYWNERNQLKAPIARAPTPSLLPSKKSSGSHQAEPCAQKLWPAQKKRFERAV